MQNTQTTKYHRNKLLNFCVTYRIQITLQSLKISQNSIDLMVNLLTGKQLHKQQRCSLQRMYKFVQVFGNYFKVR